MSRTLSIVIPSHSRPDLLAVCLQSVYRHAPSPLEVVVVDDGSADACVTAACSRFEGVTVLRRPEAGGFCVAVNEGIARVQGDIVQVLNDDTEVSPGWAEAALARFDDPRIAAVTPLVLQGPPGTCRPERIDSAGDRYFPGGVASKRWHGKPLTPERLVPGPVFGASGSGSFFRRDVLQGLGGFPEEFGAYFDDVDLSFRFHRAGWTVFYEPASRIHHRISSSYGRPRGPALARQSRNEELVFWRNLTAGTLLVMLPVHLAVLGAKAMRRLREGQLGPFLRGRMEALAALPEVLRHRRRLHSLARTCRPR